MLAARAATDPVWTSLVKRHAVSGRPALIANPMGLEKVELEGGATLSGEQDGF